MTIFVLVLRGGTHFQGCHMNFVNVDGCRITFCIFFFFGKNFISIEIFQKINLGYMNIKYTSTQVPFLLSYFLYVLKYPFYYLIFYMYLCTYPFYYLIFYMYLCT